MNKSLYNWQIAGFVFTGIAGVILHFLFDWSGESIIIAPFAAVNESVFEHMKLLFLPMFIFSIIESCYIKKEYENFWCVKLIGILLGVLLIPVLYYTINGAFGMTPDWVNIAIFFIASALSYWVETRLLKSNNIACNYPQKALLVLCLVAFIFMLLTFMTPKIPLFEDPITNTYGYNNYNKGYPNLRFGDGCNKDLL